MSCWGEWEAGEGYEAKGQQEPTTYFPSLLQVKGENPFDKTFPSTYYVPGAMLDNGDTDTEQAPLTGATAQSWRQTVKRRR